MEFYETYLQVAVDLLEKGGPVMYLLLVLSIISLSIILIKLWQFQRLGLGRVSVLRTLEIGTAPDVVIRAKLATVRHPAARVLESAIDSAGLPQDRRDVEVDRVGTEQVRALETYVRALEVISNVAPLIGLLGTVLGMINAFARLEEAGGQVDPALLAGGIWEALLTTAFGLVVAIPALGGVHYLERRVEDAVAVMKDSVAQMFVSEATFT